LRLSVLTLTFALNLLETPNKILHTMKIQQSY